ncbi:hypothetical protein HS088_TW19G00159 [Tripterygium wilfordii]|uniref:Uncharacterized protein n=1 Tax=Tripterygium wilfordii TaxID=458696 RepID=A0A7J7C8U3_TRIWF|nr:hypothetical protein HS088_TW19G00159 [Tripterygium wilfordii]
MADSIVEEREEVMVSLTEQLPRDALRKYGDKTEYPTGFPTTTNNKLEAAMGKKGDNDADVPPGFPPKSIHGKVLDFAEELKFSTGELSRSCNRHQRFSDVAVTDGSCYASQKKCLSTSAAADNRALGGKTGKNDDSNACFTPNKVLGAAMERKEGNDPYVPPGFPPKIMQLKVGDSVNEVESTTGQVLRSFDRHDYSASDRTARDVRSSANAGQGYSISAAADDRALKGKIGNDNACFTPNKVLEAAMGRKGDNDADVPPGFPPKSIQVKVEFSVTEVEPTGGEVLGSFNRHQDDVRSYAGCALDHSTSAAVDDGAIKEMELQKTLMKETTDINAAIGGPMRTMEDEDRRMNEITEIDIQIPELKLDARVARLENMIAKLKAKKFGHDSQV